jgi:hypothetical protein
MIVADASTFTRLSAVAVLVIVAALGLRWRTGNPRQATLAVMVAVLVLAGFVNGSSVPVGMLEESRISFYHWSFALAACTWLVLGLGVLDLLRPQLAGRTTFAPALTALALAAIILPAALNPWLDRESNRYSNASGNLRRRYVHQLADAVLAHRSELGAQTVLLSTGGQVFAGYPQALAYELTARGIDLRHPPIFAGSVHDDRLVKRATVESGLVLIADTSQTEASAPQGTLLAKVGLTTPDVRAFDALVAQAKSSDQVELGPAVQEGLSAIANPHARLALTFALPEITRSPRRLLTAGMLRLLRDHPIEKPRLDPELIDRVLATVPPDWAPDTATDLRLYLVSRENLKI